MSGSVSALQFGPQSITQSKQAMPETVQMNGPSPLPDNGEQNRYAANTGIHLPKPGFTN